MYNIKKNKISYNFIKNMILIFLSIVEFNNAYYVVPFMQRIKIKKKIENINNKCGNIINTTDYILELFTIIDILLPKK